MVIHRSVVRPANDPSRPNQRSYNIPMGRTGIPSSDATKIIEKVVRFDKPMSTTIPALTKSCQPDKQCHFSGSPDNGINSALDDIPDSRHGNPEEVILDIPDGLRHQMITSAATHPNPNTMIGNLFALDTDGVVQTGTVVDVLQDGADTTIEFQLKSNGATK